MNVGHFEPFPFRTLVTSIVPPRNFVSWLLQKYKSFQFRRQIQSLQSYVQLYPPARRVSSRPSDRYDFVRPHTHTTRTRTFSTNSVVVFIYSRSVLATLAQIEDVPTQIKTFYLRECAHFHNCALEF